MAHLPQLEFKCAAIQAAKTSPGPFAIHCFGAAVVKEGKVMAAEPNQTKQATDSTMHVAITSIRKTVEVLIALEQNPFLKGRIKWRL